MRWNELQVQLERDLRQAQEKCIRLEEKVNTSQRDFERCQSEKQMLQKQVRRL